MNDDAAAASPVLFNSFDARSLRNSSLPHTASFGVTAEEAILLPLRPVVAIGNVEEQGADDLFILCRGGQIDGLV